MIGYVSGVLVLMALLLNEPGSLKWCAWGVMMVGTAYAGLVVNPKAKILKEQLKDSSEAEKSTLEVRFKNLHFLSVKLNGAVLFSGLWLLWLSAAKTTI